MSVLFVTGCEPEFHGRQLSEVECQQMTCREIDIEIAKILSEIENCNQNFDKLWLPSWYDYRSKEFYTKSQNELLKQLQDLKAKKGCISKEDTSSQQR